MQDEDRVLVITLLLRVSTLYVWLRWQTRSIGIDKHADCNNNPTIMESSLLREHLLMIFFDAIHCWVSPNVLFINIQCSALRFLHSYLSESIYTCMHLPWPIFFAETEPLVFTPFIPSLYPINYWVYCYHPDRCHMKNVIKSQHVSTSFWRMFFFIHAKTKKIFSCSTKTDKS